VETGDVRKQLTAAMDRAKRAAQERRQRTGQIKGEYETFLADVATPLMRQVASALKASGFLFAVSTPGGSVRLSLERTRDDYIEVALDTEADPPDVVVRTSRTRGSRTLSDEHPVKPGVPPGSITDEELLGFLVKTLEPWLKR